MITEIQLDRFSGYQTTVIKPHKNLNLVKMSDYHLFDALQTANRLSGMYRQNVYSMVTLDNPEYHCVSLNSALMLDNGRFPFQSMEFDGIKNIIKQHIGSFRRFESQQGVVRVVYKLGRSEGSTPLRNLQGLFGPLLLLCQVYRQMQVVKFNTLLLDNFDCVYRYSLIGKFIRDFFGLYPDLQVFARVSYFHPYNYFPYVGIAA